MNHAKSMLLMTATLTSAQIFAPDANFHESDAAQRFSSPSTPRDRFDTSRRTTDDQGSFKSAKSSSAVKKSSTSAQVSDVSSKSTTPTTALDNFTQKTHQEERRLKIACAMEILIPHRTCLINCATHQHKPKMPLNL